VVLFPDLFLPPPYSSSIHARETTLWGSRSEDDSEERFSFFPWQMVVGTTSNSEYATWYFQFRSYKPSPYLCTRLFLHRFSYPYTVSIIIGPKRSREARGKSSKIPFYRFDSQPKTAVFPPVPTALTELAIHPEWSSNFDFPEAISEGPYFRSQHLALALVRLDILPSFSGL